MGYLPDVVYGHIPGTYGEYGLYPLPPHLRRRDAEQPRAIPAHCEGEKADSVAFLILDSRDRLSIATTIERLINLLDALEADADFEPDLGAPENHPTPLRNKCGPVYGKQARSAEGNQTDWGQGVDDEASLGWGSVGPHAANSEPGDDREDENEHGTDEGMAR